MSWGDGITAQPPRNARASPAQRKRLLDTGASSSGSPRATRTGMLRGHGSARCLRVQPHTTQRQRGQPAGTATATCGHCSSKAHQKQKNLAKSPGAPAPPLHSGAACRAVLPHAHKGFLPGHGREQAGPRQRFAGRDSSNRGTRRIRSCTALLPQEGGLGAGNGPVQPKACSKPRKQGAEVGVGSSVRQDQGISALYIVLPSLPLQIRLYKYLQGNDINEGRELFAASQDGRIHSSVLQLWKEIFRLGHAGGMEKGGGETSRQGKTEQVRSREEAAGARGARSRGRAGCSCLPGAAPRRTFQARAGAAPSSSSLPVLRARFDRQGSLSKRKPF